MTFDILDRYRRLPKEVHISPRKNIPLRQEVAVSTRPDNELMYNDNEILFNGLPLTYTVSQT